MRAWLACLRSRAARNWHANPNFDQVAGRLLLPQAKRTNIGIALITHPRVLFLDEPTSGLDSYTSHEVTSTCHIVQAMTADSLPSALIFLSKFSLMRTQTICLPDYTYTNSVGLLHHMLLIVCTLLGCAARLSGSVEMGRPLPRPRPRHARCIPNANPCGSR